MGIRIHKCIGYGLVLQSTEQVVNKDGYLGRAHTRGIWNTHNWVDYASNTAGIKEFSRVEESTDIAKYVVYIDYCDENYTLVLIPPGYDDWHRYDDIIDYVESNNARDTVTILSTGIFPFNSSYTDLRYPDHTKYTALKNSLMREYTNARISSKDCGKLPDSIGYHNTEYLRTELGLASIEEADSVIVPRVPDIIVNFCKWLKLFNDEKTILQLRPMIYTYWR